MAAAHTVWREGMWRAPGPRRAAGSAVAIGGADGGVR